MKAEDALLLDVVKINAAQRESAVEHYRAIGRRIATAMAFVGMDYSMINETDSTVVALVVRALEADGWTVPQTGMRYEINKFTGQQRHTGWELQIRPSPESRKKAEEKRPDLAWHPGLEVEKLD